MKKLLSILLCLSMLCLAVPAYAMGSDVVAQLIHIESYANYDSMTSTKCSTIDYALSIAKSGDVVEILKDITLSKQVVIPDGMELTFVSGSLRDIDLMIGRSTFRYTDQNAETRTLSKSFDGSMFLVSDGGKLNFENIKLNGAYSNSKVTKGGIVYAESGSEMTAKRNVTFSGAVLGTGSSGGAVYAEKDSSLSFENTYFSGNSSERGKDIFAESKKDVSIASGVNADISYDSVSIDALNVVLTGEIGVVYHIYVPEKFTSGKVKLECKNGETVIKNISECGKDETGRYLAPYNLTSVQMAEPVTCTVYDENGSALDSVSKSLVEYSDVICADSTASAKDKSLVMALVNYGHYSQIACAKANNWVVGEKYAETKLFYSLPGVDSQILKYAPVRNGQNEKVSRIDMSASLDYKTDINIYITASELPSVTVNTVPVTPVLCDDGRYLIKISGIGALNLADNYDVLINQSISVKVSALSYCSLAVRKGDSETRLAASALYEFYRIYKSYN